MVPSIDTHADSEIAELAKVQGGAVALWQLRDAGLTVGRVRRRVASGHLHVHRPGVYAAGHPALPDEGLRWAAVLAFGEDATLTHTSNAVHRGLLKSSGQRIDVTVPTGRYGRRPGIALRRAVLVDDEIELVRGLRCTSVPRLLQEMAATTRASTVERVWRQAVYAKILDVAAVAELLRRRRGERGTVLLRSLYERRLEIVGAVNGNTEELLLPIIRRTSLGEPRVNDPIWVGHRFHTVDFHFPALGLVVEGDSRLAHGDPEFEFADRQRDRELEGVGKHVHRVPWDDARWRAHKVERDLETLARTLPRPVSAKSTHA